MPVVINELSVDAVGLPAAADDGTAVSAIRTAHGAEVSRPAHADAQRWYGVYPATVADVQDPDGQGRVKVRLPWSADTAGAQFEAWARLATLMAGNDAGTWFVPDVDTEVLVAFEAGDPRRPYVVGALWNGVDAPPASIDAANTKKVLRSRNGITVTLDDREGREQLILETPGGQKVTLTDGPGAVTIEDSNGNSVKFESSGVTLTASARVTVNASSVHVSAGMVTVDTGIAKFSGVVQVDTLVANTVVASTYTPGAGNIW